MRNLCWLFVISGVFSIVERETLVQFCFRFVLSTGIVTILFTAWKSAAQLSVPGSDDKRHGLGGDAQAARTQQGLKNKLRCK